LERALVGAARLVGERLDEAPETADSWQRRRRRPETGRADDERDGRGDR